MPRKIVHPQNATFVLVIFDVNLLGSHDSHSGMEGSWGVFRHSPPPPPPFYTYTLTVVFCILLTRWTFNLASSKSLPAASLHVPAQVQRFLVTQCVLLASLRSHVCLSWQSCRRLLSSRLLLFPFYRTGEESYPSLSISAVPNRPH